MGARVAVITFPGTNSEAETVRACEAVGLDTRIVPWTASLAEVCSFDAYVLPGGFAYEDRIRAGAVAAHERVMEGVRKGAAGGKLVLGICNGAQVLLEAGLAPDLDGAMHRQAAFARNLPDGRFRSVHVYVKSALPPERCIITAALPSNAVLPAWASHGEGRFAAEPETLERVRESALAFVYCDRNGAQALDRAIVPNGSPLGIAGITNRGGNVLALMPHPERAAWGFMDPHRADGEAALAPCGGIALFQSFAAALRRV